MYSGMPSDHFGPVFSTTINLRKLLRMSWMGWDGRSSVLPAGRGVLHVGITILYLQKSSLVMPFVEA